MEEIIDRLIEEIRTLTSLTRADGGLADVLEVKSVYFGDPGIIPQSLMPCVMVEPIAESPNGETTSYDKRFMEINILLMLDAREYFEVDAEEAMGDRKLVQSAALVSRYFRSQDKRQLGGLVNDIMVNDTTYDIQDRGNAIVKTARVNLQIMKAFTR